MEFPSLELTNAAAAAAAVSLFSLFSVKFLHFGE